MIIEPGELMSLLGDESLTVFDSRFSLADTNAGREAFESSHIPGAIYVHLDEELSSPVIPGVTGRHPLPDPKIFLERMRTWGLHLDSKIVVYDDMGGGIAARMWWLLTGLGQSNVLILNGGFPAWIAAGHPTESGTRSEDGHESFEHRSLGIEPCSFRSTYENPVCSAQTVLDNLASGTMILVDSRARERFLGLHEPIDPVAGHIPDAVSYPWMDNLDETGRFLSATELRHRFSDLGSRSSTSERVSLDTDAGQESVVCYCGSGVTATHTIFAMRLSGLELPTLYAGSWSEWIADENRPVIVEQNR